MPISGTDFVRPDALAKATGAALYTQDLSRPRMLHGVIVRSQLPHATLVSVSVDAARRMPGVACVLTAQDLPVRQYGIMTADEPVLARDVVRYVGEPIALVAAETRAQAVAAAARVVPDLEPREAVTTLAAAVRPGAFEVHQGTPNVIDPQRIRRGDVDAVFRRHRVVRTEIESQRAHQTFIEPRAAMAELDANGRLLVTTSSQSPFEVRSGLARLFDLPVARISVTVPAVGGGFGGKLHLGMAPYAAAMCLATGRPVQVVCSREEEFQSPAPRENSKVVLESAVDDDGRILARRARIHLDSGAYVYDTTALVSVAALQACGAYDIEGVDVEAAAVYTNTVPTGSFRAPTGPQMAYANEAHMNDIAQTVGISPVEVRRRNLMRKGSLGPSGQQLADSALESIFETVAARVEAWRKDPYPDTGSAPGARRGYGLGCTWWNTFPAGGSASVTLGEDGSAFLYTGATEIGTGAVSASLAAIVADELGIDHARVVVMSGSTDHGPFDFGSQGSRTMYGAGGAARAAVVEVKRILAAALASEVEADPADVVFTEGRVLIAGAPATGRPLTELIAKCSVNGTSVTSSGRFEPVPPAFEPGCATGLVVTVFNEPTFHCHGAEVEVDTTTGSVRVLRYVAAHDTGPIVNPAGARGQVEGGVVQGIGYALFEEVLTDAGGVTVNRSLVDYRIPTLADIPAELEVHFDESHPGIGPLKGSKGIGEAPVILPAAAIGSAIRDALGRQPNKLPLKAETVLALV
jgi:CO/xanthine dehydrogenase Mo-binding subunit